jgi:ABC-type sugar transport system substrate-binding protein
MITRSRWATLALLVVCAIGLSATAAFSAAYPVPSGYKGVEATLPTEYKVPVKKPGTKCTLGFQNAIAANESLGWWQKGFTAQAKALGCKVIALDDQLSPDKQVSNMQQLLAQNVNVIVFYPIDPKATVPVLRQAKAKGVPVLAVDGTFGSKTATAPYLPYITSQVWQGRDIQAYLQVQAMKQAKPGANVGLIGIGAPVPALKYLNSRETYWAKKAGLKIVGSQDNPTDDVTGGEKAANGLLQRYANINAIIGYNDPSALGAYTAARGAGKQLTIVGLNGTSDGIAGLKSGRIAATVQTDAVGFGRQQAYAAYSLITKQNLPLPKIIVRPAILVTKANLSSMPSYAAQVASIK